MNVIFGILAAIFAVLLVLSIRKNFKIYSLLRKSEQKISKLQSDNKKLKTALRFGIEALQSDKDRLHKEKEEILIASKEEIKLMYKERDEKLGYFLSFFDKPLISAKNREAKPFDVEVKEKAYDEREWTSLAKFIRSLKRKKRPKAQSLIIENIGKSELIRVEGNELLINQSLDIKSLKGKK